MASTWFYCLFVCFSLLQTVQTKTTTDGKMSFEELQLEVHNSYRSIHGSPPLKLEKKLSEEAEEYAIKLTKEENKNKAQGSKKLTGNYEGKIKEDTKDKTQEGVNLNIFCTDDEDEIMDVFTTRKWYDEVCEPGYDFEGNGNNNNTAHFTQVIWKDSKEFGIGKAYKWQKDGSMCVYTVALYLPPGNIDGNYADNVPQGDFNQTAVCGYRYKKGSDGDVDGFEERQLEIHNMLRRRHDAPPLKLDAKMSTEAAEYAEKLAEKGDIKPSSTKERNGLGENLSSHCQANPIDRKTERNLTQNWYNEVCASGYDFKGPTRDATSFTQIVWKETKKLGIGRALAEKDGQNCIYVVARYSPPGNEFKDDEFTDNVQKGSFVRKYDC